MALKIFNPAVPPSPGTSMKPTFKILAAEFGDGYSQPTPDGINHRRETLTLKWDGLLEDQMKQIRKFLRDHNGTEPFYYKPAGEDALMKWTCQEFDFSIDGVWKGSVTFVQDFTNRV